MSSSSIVEIVPPRWHGETCVVLGTGPSLGAANLSRLKETPGLRIIAVNDAYRLVPYADILYACDAQWWKVHNDVPEFTGEKWSARFESLTCADAPGMHLVRGRIGGETFSYDPTFIYSGRNSGYQAVNLAIHFGCAKIILLGFDMKFAYGAHFFGDHPIGLGRGTDHSVFVRYFTSSAATLPPHVKIINANPDSGIQCFPFAALEEALHV